MRDRRLNIEAHVVGSEGEGCGVDAVVKAITTARNVASHRILHALPEDL